MRDLPRRRLAWLCTLILGVLVAAWPVPALASHRASGTSAASAETVMPGTDCAHDICGARAVPLMTREHRHLTAAPAPHTGRRPWRRAARRTRLTGDESALLPILGSIHASLSFNTDGGGYGRTVVLPPVHGAGRLAAPPRAPPMLS